MIHETIQEWKRALFWLIIFSILSSFLFSAGCGEDETAESGSGDGYYDGGSSWVDEDSFSYQEGYYIKGTLSANWTEYFGQSGHYVKVPWGSTGRMRGNITTDMDFIESMLQKGDFLRIDTIGMGGAIKHQQELNKFMEGIDDYIEGVSEEKEYEDSIYEFYTDETNGILKLEEQTGNKSLM